MSDLVRISYPTTQILYQAVRELLEDQLHYRYPLPWVPYLGSNDLIPLKELQRLIRDLERSAERVHTDNENDIRHTFDKEERFPVCSQIIETIPIYNEAVSLEAVRYICACDNIPHLLSFLNIPATKDGLDVENHNFGYHFHYGRVKSNELIRSDVLFTFDPSVDEKQQTNVRRKRKEPYRRHLYSEYHGEGHSKHVDAATIGSHKRVPIYYVCRAAAQKRNFKNFKRLGKDAQLFFLDQPDA